jgi:hypothetical protein
MYFEQVPWSSECDSEITQIYEGAVFGRLTRSSRLACVKQPFGNTYIFMNMVNHEYNS